MALIRPEKFLYSVESIHWSGLKIQDLKKDRIAGLENEKPTRPYTAF